MTSSAPSFADSERLGLDDTVPLPSDTGGIHPHPCRLCNRRHCHAHAYTVPNASTHSNSHTYTRSDSFINTRAHPDHDRRRGRCPGPGRENSRGRNPCKTLG